MKIMFKWQINLKKVMFAIIFEKIVFLIIQISLTNFYCLKKISKVYKINSNK